MVVKMQGFKTNPKILLIIGVLALVAVNLVLFSGMLSQNRSCFRDMCMYGETSNVTNEFKTLVASSSKAIIIAEGDATPTQKTAYIAMAFAQLSGDLASKEPKLIGIAVKDGTPVNCTCENYVGGNFTPCQSDLTYCESIQPAEDEVMIILKYPEYAKNEVIISGRTVTIQANSGASLSGMVTVLRELMQQS